MTKRSVMGSLVNKCVFFLCLIVCCSCYDYDYDYDENSTFTYANVYVSTTKLIPYDWRYIRVELPPYFSSTTIDIDTDINHDLKSIDKHDKSRLPIICFRDGGPPLPDVSQAALNGLVLNPPSESAGGIQILQNVDQCYPLWKNRTFILTYGQITPGVYYAGLFNGIGPIRTQSKMINRGSAYIFSANITVEGCLDGAMWGQYCNQTVDALQCAQPDPGNLQQNDGNTTSYNQMLGSLVTCRNSSEATCHDNMEPKIYSLDVSEIAEQLMITTTNVGFNQTSWDSSEDTLMCYARYNAIPEKTLYDLYVDISKAPLVIQSPKVGTWYFTIQAINQSNDYRGICYSMEWEVDACPQGKAGSNCTWERHMLQEVPTENPTVPFIYWPDRENASIGSTNFPVEPLLSTSTNKDKSDFAWTYFLVNTSPEAAGKNIHIQLISDTELNYEIYARFGGLPSLGMWDYCYTNQTSHGNNSSMFKLYDSNQERVNLYILYARVGPWIIGLRYPISKGSPPSSQTTMSVSIKSCGNQCSAHGICEYFQEASGSSSYSCCSCDRNHGGFDCSVEIVSREGQRWHSISLIASNAAAILPAFWALRQKAGAEWVIFMASGISSALYHACDVGSWCALSFHVLQFMDFWLSFMAVVSTFVYLAVMSEAAKRTIHTIVAIITALLALSGATRFSNIVLVLAIGAMGLLIGWLIEFCTKQKSISFSPGPCLNISESWLKFKAWFSIFMKMLYKRFRWCFVLLGFIAMSIAGVSWKLESTESYWIWHSMWHVTIYTSAFFFLCSKAAIQNSDTQAVPDTACELTQQDPLP